VTCPACDRAEVHPLTGIYQAGCQPCEARALAQGPAAHKRESDPGELQQAMRQAWPTEAEYRKGRALVWGWIKRMESK
jgi:hypothetical protein